MANSQANFHWAVSNMRNNEFEDALQLAVAIRNGCDGFITFDKDLVKTYRPMAHINIELLS